MPANRNALIRYKTIDACLRNRQKRWTLEMLIDKVSGALYEYEGMDKGISRRTVQADIQMMRSDKLGYNAPIVIVEKRFYTYEDPAFSITNIPLGEQDLERMNQAVEMLKQFKGFSHFENLNEVVQKLEDHVYAASHKSRPVIDFEKNENLRGLTYLDCIYQAVTTKKALQLTYQSFTAREPGIFPFHVWWLKEFKNRWFAVGTRGNKDDIYTLALDRMLEVAIDESVPYRENKLHSPETFYKDVIGVTVSPNIRPRETKIWVNALHAPYVETKPLHHSQQVLERRDDKSIVIGIFVQHNHELEKEILGFGEGMVVLSPERLRKAVKYRAMALSAAYAETDEEANITSVRVKDGTNQTSSF